MTNPRIEAHRDAMAKRDAWIDRRGWEWSNPVFVELSDRVYRCYRMLSSAEADELVRIYGESRKNK